MSQWTRLPAYITARHQARDVARIYFNWNHDYLEACGIPRRSSGKFKARLCCAATGASRPGIATSVWCRHCVHGSVDVCQYCIMMPAAPPFDVSVRCRRACTYTVDYRWFESTNVRVVSCFSLAECGPSKATLAPHKQDSSHIAPAPTHTNLGTPTNTPIIVDPCVHTHPPKHTPQPHLSP